MWCEHATECTVVAVVGSVLTEGVRTSKSPSAQSTERMAGTMGGEGLGAAAAVAVNVVVAGATLLTFIGVVAAECREEGGRRVGAGGWGTGRERTPCVWVDVEAVVAVVGAANRVRVPRLLPHTGCEVCFGDGVKNEEVAV